MAESNSMAQKSPADQGEPVTPEDVATLYSWANLHGAKYRDFSVSRAQAREESRLRVEEVMAAEQRRLDEEAERKAQEEAQLAARLAAEAAEAARQAEAERLAEIARQAEAERQAVLAAQEAQRQAAQQRAWQPPPAEAYQGSYSPSFSGDAPSPRPVTDGGRPAGRETVQAEVAGAGPANPGALVPQPPAYGGGQIADRRVAPNAHPAAMGGPSPYPPATPAQAQPREPDFGPPAYRNPVPPSTFRAASAIPEYSDSNFGSSPFPSQYAEGRPAPYSQPSWQLPEGHDARDMREQSSRPAWLAPEPPTATPQAGSRPQNPYSNMPSNYPPTQPAAPLPYAGSFSGPAQLPASNSPGNFGPATGQYHGQISNQAGGPSSNQNPNQNPNQFPSQNPGEQTGPVDDTLAGSRDRIANRWYALKNVFDSQTAPAEQVPANPPARIPVLAVFSLAGGVGKTSLVASLGRALSSRGERVLLVDTAAYGLLPFFFGARDQRPGMLRTFNPPGSSAEAPIQLVTLDPEGHGPEFQGEGGQGGGQGSGQGINQGPNQEGANQDWLAQEVGRYSRGSNRILIDLPTASGSTTRRVLRLNPVILVPVAPDMNSVVSVGAIEAFFRHNGMNSGGKQVMPFYILNQFDYSLPLHLDVREILREQIGDRLLPFALRRSAAVSEALAEGMTVMDYAPNAVVAEDYANLAGWVRSLSAPATQSYRGVRWSER